MYEKKILLKEFDWEDITDTLVWKEEDKIMCGHAEKPHYALVVKKKGSSYLKINRMFVTCGRGTFVPFGHGTYWLTIVKGRQRLLFLSGEKGANRLKEFGVHGC